jgi:coenzyme F420 hydrogenase subunit beta
MKAAETIIHLRREEPQRMKTMIPIHVWKLMEPYGMEPTSDETPK